MILALRGFAKAHDVGLSFQSKHKNLILPFNPEEIVCVMIKLICQLLVYAPAKQNILLKATLVREGEKEFIVTDVHITGIDLARVTGITRELKYQVSVLQGPDGGTTYILQWPFTRFLTRAAETMFNPQIFPSFYSEIRKHLQSHFTKADKLLATLSAQHPKDALFLKKVNGLILTNIDREGFNANHLSSAMGMSRAQLYRRLHPIIRQAPASYIQTIRIQKAKELLETTDMRIGEVAFNTGFQTPSHFTRVFIKHYGVRPSVFCRKVKM